MSTDDLFRRYAELDFHMDEAEYERMWFGQFDSNGKINENFNITSIPSIARTSQPKG